VIVVALAAGCGASNTHTVATGQPARSGPTTTSGQQTTLAALERGVREAVSQDHALSTETLWTNEVPAHTPASGGPSLTTLRKAVAQRRKAGIRVRTLSQSFRILSLQLEPSYATATVTISDDQRVQPSYSSGRPRGKSVSLHERVRLELHRLGESTHFVVWKVALLP
jgi:hypothetical protein